MPIFIVFVIKPMLLLMNAFFVKKKKNPLFLMHSKRSVKFFWMDEQMKWKQVFPSKLPTHLKCLEVILLLPHPLFFIDDFTVHLPSLGAKAYGAVGGGVQLTPSSLVSYILSISPTTFLRSIIPINSFTLFLPQSIAFHLGSLRDLFQYRFYCHDRD